MLATAFRTERPPWDPEQPTKAQAKRVVQSVDLPAGTRQLICEQNTNCVHEHPREGSSLFSCVCIWRQAPASGVDIFGSTAGSGPTADPPPTAAAATSQNLQDLMGFSDHNRYSDICRESPPPHTCSVALLLLVIHHVNFFQSVLSDDSWREQL